MVLKLYVRANFSLKLYINHINLKTENISDYNRPQLEAFQLIWEINYSMCIFGCK